jgi:tripartite-type tricarboxylate transporter receptor subunit TctC
MQGLLGGEVGVLLSGSVEALPHIKAGTAIVLAAGGPGSKEAFPNVPQLRDLHPDLDVAVWFGVFAPSSTPNETVAALNASINAALLQPDLQKKLGDYGLTPMRVSPQEMDKLVRQDLARFGPLVKTLGLVAN